MENVENFTDVFGTSDEKLIFSAEEDFNVFKMFAPLLFVHFHLWWKLKVPRCVMERRLFYFGFRGL